MTEFKTAGQLDHSDYKPDLKLVASDPARAALPSNDPQKKPVHITAGEIGNFHDWNVTPEVEVEVPTLEIVDSYNMIVEDGAALLDLTGAPAFTGSGVVFQAGAIKTNIDVSGLTVGRAFHFGLEVVLHTASRGQLIGMFIGPASDTAEQMTARMLAMTLGSEDPTDPIVQTYMQIFAGQYGIGTQTALRTNLESDLAIVNDEYNASPNGFVPPNFGVGSRFYLLMGKQEHSLNLANVIVEPNHTSYKVLRGRILTEDPVLPPGSTLFAYVIGLNFGTGYPTVSVKPFVDADTPELIINNNSPFQANYSGSQESFDAMFPDAITEPSAVTVTQATFPVGTQRGAPYNIVIDDDYTHPYEPLPYGKTVVNGQKIIVESVTDGEEDWEVLDVGVGATLGAQLTALGNQVTTLNTAISSSAKTTQLSEIVFYVKMPAEALSQWGGDELEGPDGNVFENWNAAYEYAISLPPFLRKRIVIDDRYPWDVVGPERDENTNLKMYKLMENNIVVSTLRAYEGQPYDETGPVIQLTQMRIDGLRAEDFLGYLVASYNSGSGYYEWVVALSFDANTPYGTTPDNFVLGKNAKVTCDYYALFLEEGGTIVLNDGSSLSYQLGMFSRSTLLLPITITKAKTARLTLVSNVPELADNGQKSIQLIMEHQSIEPVFDTDSSVNIVYTDTLPAPEFKYDTAVMVRSVEDIVAVSTVNSPSELVINSASYFFVVGTVDIGNWMIRPINTGKLVLMGMPGSKLVGANTNVIWSGSAPGTPCDVEIYGVDVQAATPSSRAILCTGNLKLRQCTIAADGTVQTADDTGYMTRKDTDIEGVKFVGSNGSDPIASPVDMLNSGHMRMHNCQVHLGAGVRLARTYPQRDLGNGVSISFTDVDVYMPTAQSSGGLILLSGYRPDLYDYPDDSIVVDNLRVFVVAQDGNQTETRLFETDMVAPYDHVDDPAIVVGEPLCYFHGQAKGGSVAISNIQTPAVVQYLTTQSTRFEWKDDLRIRYKGRVTRKFWVDVHYTVAAASANMAVRVMLSKNDIVGNSPLYYEEAEIDGPAGKRGVGSFSYPVTLRTGDDLYVQLSNGNNTDDYTLDRFTVAIREA